MKKYPLQYYLILIIALILSMIFWFILLSRIDNFNFSYHKSQINNHPSYKLIPVDKDKIIDDEDSNRRIVSNIVNVAIKDTTNLTPSFLKSFSKNFNQDYRITYADSTINFFQISLPANKRISFKEEVKKKLSNFDLLVWDESIFISNDNDSPLSAWHMDATNLREFTENTDASNIVIAIIDNGFDLSHPSLHSKIIKPFNAIDESDNVSPSNVNHGTHVASIAAGNPIRNTSIEGVCSTCKIMPIKISDYNDIISTTYIIKGVLYAVKNQADVVNLSFGTEIIDNNIPIEIQQQFIENGAKDEESFWNELFNYAEKNKTICVLAAGNQNILTGFVPFQRAVNTIKVGALDKNSNKASFSNFGSLTTIYAPGENITGAAPNNSFEALSGTSMAAPIVSGFIGLLKSQNKNANLSDIHRLLIQNSVDVNDLKILKYLKS